MKHLSPEEIGYLAGIVDGEGTIEIPRNYFGFFTLRLTVGSTTEELIVWLSDKLEQPYNTRPPLSEKHSVFYSMTLGGVHAKEVLGVIVPCMIVKRPHALIALEFPVGSPKDRTHRLTEDQRLAQAICHIRIAKLNRKGPLNQHVEASSVQD